MRDADAAIRLLTLDDLEDALTLSSTAGWNQRREDWRKLHAIAPDGSFAAVVDGRIVGTAIGIDYVGFGWIAMMLVDPAYRGQGLGRGLLQAAMDAIPPDRPIRLDATPMGRPLYQSFGFEDEASLSRYVSRRFLNGGDPCTPPSASARGGPMPRSASARRAAPDRSNDVEALTRAHLRPISERDRQIFGGNRAAVLEWALECSPQYARVAGGERSPEAYCFGREGRLFDQIGPVVAADDDTARRLITAALPGAAGRAVVIDAFDSQVTFTAWLKGCGFKVERPLFRMRRPARRPAYEARESEADGLREFGIFGPEFG